MVEDCVSAVWSTEGRMSGRNRGLVTLFQTYSKENYLSFSFQTAME